MEGQRLLTYFFGTRKGGKKDKTKRRTSAHMGGTSAAEDCEPIEDTPHDVAGPDGKPPAHVTPDSTSKRGESMLEKLFGRCADSQSDKSANYGGVKAKGVSPLLEEMATDSQDSSLEDTLTYSEWRKRKIRRLTPGSHESVMVVAAASAPRGGGSAMEMPADANGVDAQKEDTTVSDERNFVVREKHAAREAGSPFATTEEYVDPSNYWVGDSAPAPMEELVALRNKLWQMVKDLETVPRRKEALVRLVKLTEQSPGDGGIDPANPSDDIDQNVAAVVKELMAHVLQKPKRQSDRLRLALGRFCVVALEEMLCDDLILGSGNFFGLRGNDLPSSTGQKDPAPEVHVPLVSFDLAAVYEGLLNTDQLPGLPEMMELVRRAQLTFESEVNVVTFPFPSVIVGDIHGQILDLKDNILAVGGPLGETPYVFLGDYVDRGASSLHVVALLVAAKLMYPSKVFLLRGNHEGRLTNRVYGFLQECHTRYPLQCAAGDGDYDDFWNMPNHPLWEQMNLLFDSLPIAALIGGRVLAMHGGLSPNATTIDAILGIDRKQDIEGGPLADLTWSDPSEMPGFVRSSRGCGHLFGRIATFQFLFENSLDFLIRAHQCVREGFSWRHADRVLTVFSAPNYCGQGNKGVVVLLRNPHSVECVQYGEILAPAEPLKEVPSSFV